ncbi:HemK2/MTQ2 family protein methyltransferase [Streptomyces xantholiticus]|uniref:HemK2/MTQ2 family protein methyltransferase n=1 Tax=Streptomyces xantholiticus TaxID=68285 RepID=UPI001675EE65|nr:HemK2/MTQ2 family protein methyltransferase [Streptomyces xantholiticus]GGW39862.1 methyltransferase [Streptomyces xantholiticus]
MHNVPGVDRSADTLVLAPGVYAPQSDTFLLADALEREPLRPDAEVLDVGTGPGTLALAAARRGARVTAVDTSWRAVAATRLNAVLARRKVRVLRGDLLDPAADRRFDLILCNPPYVPAPHPDVPRRGSSVAWDAGHDGRAVLDRVCDGAADLLHPGGALLLVHSALSGVQATLDRLSGAGLDAAVVERRLVPFGPVLRSRADWLERQGLIAPGEEKEELVIIRADRA